MQTAKLEVADLGEQAERLDAAAVSELSHDNFARLQEAHVLRSLEVWEELAASLLYSWQLQVLP